MSTPEALEHLRAGRAHAAAELLERQVRNQPDDARAWFLLGASRHALNQLDTAEAAFARSSELDPRNPEAWLARVTVLRAGGKAAPALEAALEALRALTGNARLHYAAALAADELGQTVDALAQYEQALRIDPLLEDALHNRGLLLLRAGYTAEAIDNQRHYVRAFPQSARAYSVLADAFLASGEFEAALQALEAFERLAPDDISAPIRRGVALAGLRRYDEAREIFAQARERDAAGVSRFIARIAPESDLRYVFSPENLFLWQGWLALGRCDWSWWSAFVSEMRRVPDALDVSVEPAAAFMAFHLPLSGAERHAVARRIAADIEGRAQVLAPRAPARKGRLRVGVLSPDLREHLNAYLLLPFFQLLDRDRFELYAYSLAAGDGSGIRRQLAARADRFTDLQALGEDEAACAIYRDDIDILIDAGGHTSGSRFGITARRPARLQCAYLGFAGSLGSSRVDFALTDRIAARDPAEWTEGRIDLPNTYFLYDFRNPPPPIALARADYGLPEDAFVYCAFHKAEKISPDAFLLWTRILRLVPASVLWLLALPGAAQRNLRLEATSHGVDPARLVFAPFDSRERYLARQRLGDLLLDAPHHSAMTTACDAFAGTLPMLTLHGTAMASRAGESLLRAAGLPDLVCPDKEAFVAEAVRLASDRPRLESYRRRLAARDAPLFDTAGRVREIETALLEMWDRYLRGLKPA